MNICSRVRMDNNKFFFLFVVYVLVYIPVYLVTAAKMA